MIVARVEAQCRGGVGARPLPLRPRPLPLNIRTGKYILLFLEYQDQFGFRGSDVKIARNPEISFEWAPGQI